MSDRRSEGRTDQWLDGVLNELSDKPLPSHLAARLAEMPARHPRLTGRSLSKFWSMGLGLTWLSWGAAAALGTMVGLWDTGDLDTELSNSTTLQATTGDLSEVPAGQGQDDGLNESEQSLDEWQQLAAVALGTNWDGEL